MSDVIMPRLSDSMEEGTIIRWLKADGDPVERDEELVEIETDKATAVYEAESSGVLAIAVREGETVAVGAVIARLGEAGQAPESSAATAAHSTAAPTAAASGPGDLPSPAPATRERPGDSGASFGPGNGQVTVAQVNASPLARRIAERLSVDLAAVQGSGPAGRVLKRDVVAAAGDGGTPPVAAQTASAIPDAQPAPPALATPRAHAPHAETARGQSTSQALTRTQALIARRMAESRATVPDFALEVDVDMTAMLEGRAQLNRLADPAPSLNDIIVKACALSLRRHPRANASFSDGGFLLHERVNVGVAVAVEDALIVPTVFDADRKSLQAIASETRGLVTRARERSLAPPELAGATFTVSNLGMYGIDRFEGVINPPQAAILCVGAISARPVVRDGKIEARSMMTATLACDHRILYGANAAEFLAEIRRTLEEPLSIAL